MNEAIKKLWTDALRSGQFRQGKNKLVTIMEDGTQEYCCLGVLCELAAKNGVNLNVGTVYSGDDGISFKTFDMEANVLPYKVMYWAGLREHNPHTGEPDAILAEVSLAQLNDDGGSFEEIANVIERDL